MFYLGFMCLVIGILIGLMFGPSTERIEAAFNEGFMQGLEVGQENSHRGKSLSKFQKKH